MEELKPCPFCGGEAELRFFNNGPSFSYRVECLNCTAMVGRRFEEYSTNRTFWFGIKQEAIDAWNTRDDDTDVPTKERTCHVQVRKRGMIYDVFYFDCCDKEWVENSHDGQASKISGDVCPYCGAEVVKQ